MARGARLASATPVSTWLLSFHLLVFFLLPLLVQVVLAAQAPRYEFQIELYDQPLPWQKCPEGWRKHGKKCYKVFIEHVSWEDANKVCKSLGGSLAKVSGFNQNRGLGWMLQEALAERQTKPTDGIVHAAAADQQQVWIGLKRGSSGDYSWANGSPGYEKEGFWDRGSPPTFSNSNNVNEQCCDINLNSTELGQFRWHLGGCDRKRIFVCEMKACNKRHFHCVDGRRCVSEKSICDGVQDCDDGSDEMKCEHGDACGGSLEGERGTFQSPGYPRKYPKHAACLWRVQTPVGTKVQLWFESFDIEHKYDSVEVYDGSEKEASALLGHYSGKSIPAVPLATSNFLLVILTSDRSKEAYGFNATWSAVMFDGPSGTCGGELKAQSSVQWFTSPLFPSPYPDNLVCDWVITSSSASDIITLQFQDFELEDAHDWVEVHDGLMDSDRLFERFSGSQLPKIITSTSSGLFVRFKTDFTYSMRGFNATYTTGCSVDISSGYAKIESPGYGVANYPSNVDCSWTLTDPQKRKLNLVFNPLFETEPAMDVVKVYNSSQTTASHLAAEVSGLVSSSSVRSTGSVYVVQFSSDATVQRSGWSASISFDCEPLRIERPLEINTTSVVFGTVVQYQCAKGYTLQGANHTVCDMQGLWRPDALPSCQLIDCGSPNIPRHGYLVSLSGTTYGESAVYNCSKGYDLSGSHMSTCRQQGWSALPQCQEIYCPKQPPPLHGSAMAEDNRFGALREFFCHQSYRLVGAKFSYCTADGVWTSSVPECHLLQCPGIAGIINGKPDPDGPVRVGEKVEITCEEGYYLEGHSQLTCLASLDYDQPVPYCRDVNECEGESICVDDGHHTCQNLVGSYRCVCDTGYQHPDNNLTLCEDIDECESENGGCNHLCNNKPSSYECSCRQGYTIYQGSIIVIGGGQLVPNKTCIAPCEALKVSGGTVAYTGPALHGGFYLHPTEAIVACPAGDVPDGPARLMCQEQGGWSAQVSKCQTSVCPLLDTPVNGQVFSNGQTLGSKATYTCHSGFRLKGPAVRFCQLVEGPATSEQKLMWTGSQPSCHAMDCGAPPEPANGVVFYSSTTLDSVATYSCRCGFQLDGSSIRRCLSSGLWSGNNTQCNAQGCPNPGRPLYGSMVESWDTFPVGSVVQFQCDRPGYKLSDPWPMECLSPPSYQVSPVLPLYRVSVSMSFVTGDYSSVTTTCGVYYQGEAVRMLREFVPQLQLLCVSYGQPRISVNNETTMELNDSLIHLTGWYEVRTDHKDNLTSSCNCGRSISRTLSDFISNGSQLLMLDGSQELGCSPAFMQRDSVDTSEQGWTCPLGLGLTAVDGQCGQGVPACMEACVPESLPATTPSPAYPTTTTTTIITFPTPTPSTSTTSSPSTTTTDPITTTSAPLAVATSMPVKMTESTIKDISLKSTTVSPTSVTEDRTSAPQTSSEPSTASSATTAATSTTTTTITSTTTTPTSTTTASLWATDTSTDYGHRPSSTQQPQQNTTDLDTDVPNAITQTASSSATNMPDTTKTEAAVQGTSSTDTVTQATLTESTTRRTSGTDSSTSQMSTTATAGPDPNQPATETTYFTTQRPLMTVEHTTSPTVTETTTSFPKSEVTSTPQTSNTMKPTSSAPETEIQGTTATLLDTETTQSQVATVDPHTTQRQRTTQAPQTTKRPQTTQAPQTTKRPQTTQAPQTTKRPQTTQAPQTTKRPQTTQAPKITQAPQATEGSHVSQTKEVPQTTQESGSDQSQDATTQNTQVTLENPQTTTHPPVPQTAPDAQTTEGLETTQAPQITEGLKTTQPAGTTDRPKTTQTPQTTESSQISEKPQTTQGPQTTDMSPSWSPHTTQGSQTTLASPSTTTKNPQDRQMTQRPQTTASQTTPAPQTTQRPQTPAPQATQKPQTTKRPQTTQAPQTTQRPQTPAPQATQRPQTTKRPQTTQAPQATQRPTTQRPQTTQRPTTQKPQTTQRPTTQRPQTTQRPTTQRPQTTQKPQATQRPQTTQAPQTRAPKTTQAPLTTRAPYTTKTPQTTQPVQTTQAPQLRRSNLIAPAAPALAPQVEPEAPYNPGETSAVITEPEYTTDPTGYMDIAWPLFLIEVEDNMEGSFTNITCIDEVHLDINSKVNEAMRDFISHIGKTACLNASDVTLELMSGNIRFKGAKAKIFIQFSLKYRSSQPEAVESCAEEFKVHILSILPAKFQLVSQHVVPTFCQLMSYQAGSTNVTRTSWDCPEGYQLDPTIFVCQRISSAPFSSLPAATPTPSATTPPVPIDTIPRMTLTFQGTFTQIAHYGKRGMTACISEYNSGLMSVLRDLEPHVQNHHSDCSDIFVDITTNLSLTVHDANSLAVTAQVRLLPLAEWINLPAEHLCASYITSLFEEPAKQLPNVTLPESYLENCSSIQLTPALLTSNSDLIFYSCAEGFVYDAFNFLCVDEALPSYAIQIDLTIQDIATQISCRQAVELSAKDLSQQVVEDVHAKLHRGLLCNSSTVGDRVVLLPRNSRLSLTSSKAVISLPFVLLSVHGQSAPVEKCTTHLYTYLAASLGDPVSSMMVNVTEACPDVVGPQNYTRAAEEWSCFEGRVYNAQAHSCDRFGALEESITKTKGLMSERKRRDTYNLKGDTKPYWNTTLPVCQDQEPPSFSTCPKTSVEVHLGASGPVPVIFDIPSPSDNSGGALIVTYQPVDFRLPYTFRQNMTVNISAVDPSGNKAVCRISVLLLDVTPPRVQCPRELFRQHYDSDSSTVAVVYPEGLVMATDYGGVSHTVYTPAPGTLVEVLKEFNVTATVFDLSGNTASCSFRYIAGTDRCALWELPVPADGKGQRSCSSKLEGSVGFGVSCQVSCPRGYDFVTQPPAQYVCINGSVWHPHNNVPDCGVLSFANFDFNLTMNFTYDGTINHECAGLVSTGILSRIQPFFRTACTSSIQFLDIKIEHMGFFDSQGPMFIMKMKVSITLKAGTSTDSATKCGAQILSQMDEFTAKITVENCGNASFLPPSDSQGQAACFPGSAHISPQSCLECPAGTYMTSSGKSCEQCPKGQYQNQSGQVACESCPPGTSTLAVGSSSLSQCLGGCAPGSYSPTSLSPCQLCERGEYQPDSGQTSCIPCADSQSTAHAGAANAMDCKELCWYGYYSKSGLAQCSSCPQHTYSDERGATECTECPPDKVTLGPGRDSKDDCLVVKWCRGHSCAEGATCVDQHRFAQCLCPPGFTGELCDVNIDECASQPCVNGATCQDGINSYTCQCSPGYEGSNCELETDECGADPCVHGLCVDGHLSYNCVCYNGFAGSRCEVDIDECAGAPCKNGGRCLDLVAGYLCDCSGTGYEGTNCQEDIINCSESSCLNGGTCHELVNGFNCTCSPGFSGDNCEEDIDECKPYPCSNNAMCVDGVHSYQCICQPGYTGERCRQEINECASSPCVNDGTCTDLVNDYLCTCSPGYKGKNCELDVDDCASSPCNAEGTERCEDGINSFTCHCLDLWQGDTCENQADPCEASPCAEDATCTAVADTFVCACPPDFTGTPCDHHLDDCESGPCMNNATCVDGVHSFSCECSQGFSGKVCDVNVDECASQPCANGATCRDLINGYTCSCAAGYEGETCKENIDDCARQPCANGGTCKDRVHNFKCFCPDGYTGKACTEDVDECLDSPCQNGATCINLQGRFYCECPAGYSGDICEQDPCSTSNSCLNNATCVSRPGGVTCLCPPQFTGVDCGKERSGDFDLQFHGKKNAACRPPALIVPTDSQLAVCLWVRYAVPNAQRTVLTLARSYDDADNRFVEDDILLDMTGSTVSVSLEGEREPRSFSIDVTDGGWHHVCYQWLGSQHALYVDGVRTMEEMYGVEVSLPDRVKLVLGQPTDPTGEYFQGEISQANVFTKALDQSQISAMGSNCSDDQLVGDMYAWPLSEAYLIGEVSVVTPALCGRSQCPPGFYGSYCDLERDKTSPTVVSCPSDQTVTNSSLMVQVEWEEPVFEDNVGIISIQQTHRSGQAFRQGEYVVTYVAYDAENNSAECSFEIIIRPFDCQEPPPPTNGGKVCQTWQHGSFCSVSCFPSYQFVELPPPFYTCGKLGFWDPPRGNPFRFPPCTLMFQPEVTLVGIVDVRGPGCTEAFRAALKTKFTQIMTELDALLGLCKTDSCDFKNGFSVTCDEGGRGRKKRDTSVVFHVVVNLDIAADSSAVQKSSGNWAAEEIATAVKQGRFNDDTFTADPTSVQLSVDYLCQDGQVLRVVEADNVTRTCLDCPPGYYYDRAGNNCELCAEGSYTAEPRQTQCVACPEGTTTTAPGSTSSEDCFELCLAGSYYSAASGQCVLCPPGQYQGSVGQTSCLNCPTGQSTERPGATAVEQCGNVCELGQEISGDGNCRPCPRGSYQESRDLPVCLPCPYGWTTPTVGAMSLQNCNVVVCDRGHWRMEGNHCELCPVGTYQPLRDSDHCIPCGVGLTTAGPGAVSQSQCQSGPVDECSLGTHQCHDQATCVDTEQEYYCLCQPGYTGDGFNCTDLCDNYCDNQGVCDYQVDGEPFCNCRHGYTGQHCQEEDLVAAGLSSAVAGGVAGSVVAVFVILIIAAVCYWRHRTQRKKSHDRIYRSHHRMAPAAFYNEGYESIRDSTPSQLIVHEQTSSTSSSSSLSIAPRWNRSTFANSDEDETDACWFESLHMDDLSLGSDAFTRTARLEAEAYF